MSGDRLDLLLSEVARAVDYPETPDLSSRVANRLEREPTSQDRRARRAWRHPALVAAAVILLAAAFTVALSPTARRAVADLLGVVGIEIRFGDEERFEGLPPTPEILDTDLGERVSVAEAERTVGFEVKGPATFLGPSRVYVDRSIGDTGMVSTVFYPPRNPDRIVYLITEFRASVDSTFVKKVATEGTRVRYVDVRGRTGYWLTGDPHVFLYMDETGRVREETVRLAGKVLLWEEDGITYRIEGTHTLEDALRAATHLR